MSPAWLGQHGPREDAVAQSGSFPGAKPASSGSRFSKPSGVHGAVTANICNDSTGLRTQTKSEPQVKYGKALRSGMRKACESVALHRCTSPLSEAGLKGVAGTIAAGLEVSRCDRRVRVPGCGCEVLVKVSGSGLKVRVICRVCLGQGCGFAAGMRSRLRRRANTTHRSAEERR